MELSLNNLYLCERGNTLLTDYENMVAWLDLEGDTRLEVAYNPGNYPALNVQTITITDEDLAKHINENLQYWLVCKCHIDGVNIDANGEVASGEE